MLLLAGVVVEEQGAGEIAISGAMYKGVPMPVCRERGSAEVGAQQRRRAAE